MKAYCSTVLAVALVLLSSSLASHAAVDAASRHGLSSDSLARTWDEAIPLGNGMLGALIWQKDGSLRMSLDRADLWDLRPMQGLDRKEFSYWWVLGQVQKKDYGIVQQYFDAPYETEPAPSKIPGAALEFDLGPAPVPAGDTSSGSGATPEQERRLRPKRLIQRPVMRQTVLQVRLDSRTALCEVLWSDSMKLTTFVHATEPVGWFRFERVQCPWDIRLVPPAYEGTGVRTAGGSVQGDDLVRLGYVQGNVARQGTTITYRQNGWGGFSYEVTVAWRQTGSGAYEGAWTISSRRASGRTPALRTAEGDGSSLRTAQAALRRGMEADLRTHRAWWGQFWMHSSVTLPDPLLERQWYLEQYKFGAAARRGAPPISLQAVWTADNGRLPPWKGDFHHDLNTQLSYWPCYSGNHLEEGLSYFDYLDAAKPNFRRYTKRFFAREGLAVPGVTTLDGDAMGGWIQYSCSPTVSAWLAQHYYLHWRYSMDTLFLARRAYPWLKETALFLEKVSARDARGVRRLPIGSSPEIHDNSLSAWFTEWTNYDLALTRFTFGVAAEMAAALGKKKDAAHWTTLLGELPAFALSPKNELLFSPSLPYNESHRHFSHMMAIHPLGLIRWADGEHERQVIHNSIARLDSVGPKLWCGYSYAWLGNLKARARDGDGAARALTIFAKAFCLPNSFHANGDQTRSGLSDFTYRPFTLEGNFAFAAGIQEMLMQSYAGTIELFPAIPESWKDVAFTTLRAEGAFLVSAERKAGRVTEVSIRSEKGGTAKLKNPFAAWQAGSASRATASEDGDYLVIQFQPKGEITLLPR